MLERLDTTFDYAFIGCGCAAMHLILKMLNDSAFDDKRILILDKEKKTKYERTWSFWEEKGGPFDSILEGAWNNALFFGDGKEVKFNLGKYEYKTIRSDSFYSHFAKSIHEKAQVTNVTNEVTEVAEKGDHVEIKTKTKAFKAKHIFDSRIPKDFYDAPKEIHIQQHFKGWTIRTDNPTFDPGVFTIMDYRSSLEGTTCFLYVLPFSETQALVELTYFTESLVAQDDYDALLKKYISDKLHIESYDIEHVEYGIIPMSTFPFKNYSSAGITKVGTAGGWVKASSGYMFKIAQDKADIIIQNIKSSRAVSKNLFRRKYAFYDRLLLDVLENENGQGERIFAATYKNNPPKRIFNFLDEQSSLFEDLLYIFSLPKWPFIRAFFRQYVG